MPVQTYEFLGDVLVFDGGNAAEFAEWVPLDSTPEPDEGVLEFPVNTPFGMTTARLEVGDALVSRGGGRYLATSAASLESYQVTTP